MKKENITKKIIKEVAVAVAKKGANQTCWGLFYQSELPKAVKKLRRF